MNLFLKLYLYIFYSWFMLVICEHIFIGTLACLNNWPMWYELDKGNLIWLLKCLGDLCFEIQTVFVQSSSVILWIPTRAWYLCLIENLFTCNLLFILSFVKFMWPYKIALHIIMIKATSTFHICETSTLEISNHPIPFHSIFHPQNKVLHDYASSSKLPFQKERSMTTQKKKKRKKRILLIQSMAWWKKERRKENM